MNREEMLEFLPHRGLNLLLDGYRDLGDGEGEGRLTIAKGDPLGRDLFSVDGRGGRFYLSPFLVEHAALTCVLVIREEMRGGRLAFFSTISRFESAGEAPLGAPVVSRVTRGRDRGEFRNFKAEVGTADGSRILSVSVMAYLAPHEAELGSSPSASVPGGEIPGDADLFPCVAPALAFVHANGRGAYGSDHPHVPGHFPGAPVMMGMAQWLAVAEAAGLTASPGRSEVSGSGRLVKEDGATVVEVSGLRVGVEREAAGSVTGLRILGTKRVAFREKVVPGDSYFAEFEPG